MTTKLDAGSRLATAMVLIAATLVNPAQAGRCPSSGMSADEFSGAAPGVAAVAMVNADDDAWRVEYERLDQLWQEANAAQDDEWRAYQADWDSAYDVWAAYMSDGQSDAASQVSQQMDAIRAAQSQSWDAYQAYKDQITERQRELMRDND